MRRFWDDTFILILGAFHKSIPLKVIEVKLQVPMYVLSAGKMKGRRDANV